MAIPPNIKNYAEERLNGKMSRLTGAILGIAFLMLLAWIVYLAYKSSKNIPEGKKSKEQKLVERLKRRY